MNNQVLAKSFAKFVKTMTEATFVAAQAGAE
jgi:hypothetical protein